jgi:Phosphotransferase enzyme family
MLAPPLDLTDEVVTDALARGWSLAATSLDYRPVGWGSHHWEAVCAAGTRWFVTVDDLEGRRQSGESSTDAAYARLKASLAAAVALKEAGRDFVVAPVQTLDDQPVLRAGRFGVALYPYVDGQSFAWGEFSSPEHLRAVLDMLIETHTAPVAVRQLAGRDDFTIAARDQLAATLACPAAVEPRGPYTRPMAELIASHVGEVQRLLDWYDRLVAQAGTRRLVLTHGEPHPGNTMLTAEGWRLIDWDTVLVAPPERDLWSLEPVHDEYARLTGIELLPPMLELYRLRWMIADIAFDVRRFRRDHSTSPDDDQSWELLQANVRSLS